MRARDGFVVGWDIGGAHVKACLLRRGEVFDATQWACPLWQGLDRLDAALAAARARWPEAGTARHAVTMTGEMVDLFAHREDGVLQIAGRLARAFDGVRFYAGDAGWCAPDEVSRHWDRIASANWLATAVEVAKALEDRPGGGSAECLADGLAEGASGNGGTHAAAAARAGRHGAAPAEGVLIDIGSTTTDLIALRHGRVLTAARSDAERLATGELVYHGVVRTPLCALAPRVAWRGRPVNVMNELFATTADVYRLGGELDPQHDLHPAADNAAKDAAATCRRLARMIGMDARDGSALEWAGLARAWRSHQVDELAGQLRRVRDAHGLGANAVLVSAGCGDFLARDVFARSFDLRHAGDGAGPDSAGAGERGASEPGETGRAGAMNRIPHAERGGAGLPSERAAAHLAFGTDVARIAADAPAGRDVVARRAQVGAPCVAVAALFEREYG